mmetsp:Transcript_29900/g.87305  ORF Transcript_29900/g.87305 Transcript_29900/m.87305 type:complete len:663 (+) Transcript_29900:256-2244(+)
MHTNCLPTFRLICRSLIESSTKERLCSIQNLPILTHGIGLLLLLLLRGTVSAAWDHAAHTEAGTRRWTNGGRSLRIIVGLLSRLTGHRVVAIGLRLLLRRGAGTIDDQHTGLGGGGIKGVGLHHLLAGGLAHPVSVQVLHLGEGATDHPMVGGLGGQTARLGRTLLVNLLVIAQVVLVLEWVRVHGQLFIDGLLVDVVEVDEGLESLGDVVEVGDAVGGGIGGKDGGAGVLNLGGGGVLLILLDGRLLVVLLLLSRRFLIVLLLGLGRGGELSLGGILVELLGRRLLIVLLLDGRLGIVLLLLLRRGRSTGRQGRNRRLLSLSLGGTVQVQDAAGNVVVSRCRGSMGRELIELRLGRGHGGDAGIEQRPGLVHQILPRSGEGSAHEVIGRRGRRGRSRGDLGGDRVHAPLGLVCVGAAGPSVLLLDGEAVVVVGLPTTGTGSRASAALVLDHAPSVAAAGLDAELIDAWEAEEAHAVQEQLELLEVRAVAHGRGGVGHDLEHVVAPHGPARLEFAAGGLAHGEVDLLAVHQHQPLAAGEGPDEGDLVLLSAAVGAGAAAGEGLPAGEAEAPTDATLGLGHHLARRGGRHVDLVDRVRVEIVLGRVGPGGGTCWSGHGSHFVLDQRDLLALGLGLERVQLIATVETFIAWEVQLPAIPEPNQN